MATNTDAGQQQVLIPGGYRCHNCGRDVAEPTQKRKRFRLCAECWAVVVPPFEYVNKGDGPDITAAVAAYNHWYTRMERRYPLSFFPFTPDGRFLVAIPKDPFGRAARIIKPPPPTPNYNTDTYYPMCECGRPRPAYRFPGVNQPVGLFGGPFMTHCERCQAKQSIDSYFRLHTAIHPDWDDEAWLDALYKLMPEAFDWGLLPDYWYELRLREKEQSGR